MPDYSKCIIYTIRTPTGLYVGSTCNFTRRKHNHNSGIHNEKCRKYNIKLYKNIRENGGEWEMKPYSEFPCKNKMEMNIEEERIRRELNADLNSKSCYGLDKEKGAETKKQYVEKNREKINEYKYAYQKEYRKNNKEKVAEQVKQYYEKNKEKHAERKKENYEKNKEQIAEKQKPYYQHNKEQINQKQRQYYQKRKAEKLASAT
jgi:hypothetical protein